MRDVGGNQYDTFEDAVAAQNEETAEDIKADVICVLRKRVSALDAVLDQLDDLVPEDLREVGLAFCELGGQADDLAQIAATAGLLAAASLIG